MGRRQDEGGFTLVELMVVVLILAVLIAIGLPTFLGARARAFDRAARALVRRGLIAQIVHNGNARAFTDDAGDLSDIEPNIAWGTLAAKDKGATAHVTGAGDQAVILRSESGTGTIFCLARIADTADAGTYYTTGCDGTETRAAIVGWPTTAAAW